MSADVTTPPVIWRQYIMVRGGALRLLQSLSDIELRDPMVNNTLTLEGDGPYFPTMHGLSWAAMCCARQADEAALGDLSLTLRALLDSTLIPMSDAPAAEVEAWLRTIQGDGR